MDSIDSASFEDAATVEVLREGYLQLLQAAFTGGHRIVRTTHHEASMDVPVPTGPPIFGEPDNPARDWILFEVLRPIPRWPEGTRWGLPTVAPRGLATQEGDTVQKPPPEEGLLDRFAGSIGVPPWALVLGGAVVVGGLVYAVVRR